MSVSKVKRKTTQLYIAAFISLSNKMQAHCHYASGPMEPLTVSLYSLTRFCFSDYVCLSLSIFLYLVHVLKVLHHGVNLLFGFTVYYPFVFFKQKLNKLFQRLKIFSRGSFLWVFFYLVLIS